MEHQPGTETSTPVPIDYTQSVYGAAKQSRDFGDKRYFPDIATLETLHLHWSLELRNPERSPRSIKEIGVLVGRLLFEIASREGEARREVEKLENTFQIKTDAPEVEQIYTPDSHQSEQQAA